jgi:hypothetical protein
MAETVQDILTELETKKQRRTKTDVVARRIEKLLQQAAELAKVEDVTPMTRAVNNALATVKEYAHPNTASQQYCEGCGRMLYSWYDHKDNCPNK